MPDVSNEDLQILIYRVIRKISGIEEKLSNVLDWIETEKQKTKLVNEEEFSYTPINDEDDLKYVNQKISTDPKYLADLVRKSDKTSISLNLFEPFNCRKI